jgi:hypothetical protein
VARSSSREVGTMNQPEWFDEPTVDGYGRITLGRWGGWTIDICPMLFNDRVVLTPEANPGVYDYGWCYPKGGAALLAALAWNPATEAEPAGYIKAVRFNTRQPGEVAA